MGHAISVVIVDDNTSFVQAICRFFNNLPHIDVIGTANSIKEAYNLILENKPDAVLLDVRMPQAHALMLVSLIKAEDSLKNINFFVMATEEIEVLMQRIKPLGITYCMVKPFDFDVAAERIYSLCSCENQNMYDNPFGNTAKDSRLIQIENKVNAVLYAMSLTPNMQGFRYLKDSVLLVLKKGAANEDQKASAIYMTVASHYHTTPECVERAIHYVKTVAARKNEKETEHIFSCCAPNLNHPLPTNLHLIQAISSRIL